MLYRKGILSQLRFRTSLYPALWQGNLVKRCQSKPLQAHRIRM